MNGPLERACSLQRDAAAEGFDWADVAELWPKLAEEVAELRAATSPAACIEELGDLLFMVVNIARHLQVDAADALEGATKKFARRYAYIQAHAQQLPPRGDPGRLAAMEALWVEAKRLERLNK